MTDTELLGAVAEAIRAACEGTQHAVIEPKTRLIEDLGLDSLDLVSTMMHLQDRHRVELDVEAVQGFQTVADLITELGRQFRTRAA